MNISLVQRHVRHVLHQHGRRPGALYYLQEGLPQVPALVARIRVAVADTVPDLAPAGSRERLAGRPSDQEFHFSSRYQLGDLSHAIRITQVPVQRKAAEVMTMRLELLQDRGQQREPHGNPQLPARGSGRLPR